MGMNEQEVRSAVAKLIVFGFHGKTVNSHARTLIRAGAGGVILFSRNIGAPEQVSKLCRDLKKEAGDRPLIIMIDQEGGRVTRMGPPFTPVPSARLIGSTQDPEAAAAAGMVLGRELRAVHIDMNLAPVLDVDTNPSNPIISSRSFGGSARLVSQLGCAFIRAVQAQGVAACSKHFPGHGDTILDSHVQLPTVNHGLDRLQNLELVPFGAAIHEANVAAIMTAHLNVPALQSSEEVGRLVPATMSRGAIDYIRKQLKFQGVIVSDCMEMGAVTKNFSCSAACVEAVLAGVDMLLVCHRKKVQLGVISALARGMLDGKIQMERVHEAAERISKLVEAYVEPFQRKDRDLDKIGCKEHRDAIENILHHSAAMSS